MPVQRKLQALTCIPRLLMLHAKSAPPTLLVEALLPSRADIGGLAEIVLGSDIEAAAGYVTVLRERGQSVEGKHQAEEASGGFARSKCSACP